MRNDEQIGQRKPISFKQFKSYCSKLVPILNNPDTVQKQNKFRLKDFNKQVLSYKASFKILNSKFSKQHDCEYLQVEQLSQQQIYQKEQIKNEKKSDTTKNFTNNNKRRKVLLKINITYSLSYQIPLLMFMPYHFNFDQLGNQQQQPVCEQIPFSKDQIKQIINQKIGSDKLNPLEDQTGVFIVQNHINKQYFYTLHHCYMDTHQMNINQIIPYYLAIVGCHPQIVI